MTNELHVMYEAEMFGLHDIIAMTITLSWFRLISEKEAEVSLCKQQLQQLEQEKLTAVTALKRQVAALEETRVEITKIKETHRYVSMHLN